MSDTRTPNGVPFDVDPASVDLDSTHEQDRARFDRESPTYVGKHYGPSDKATLPAKMSTKVNGLSFLDSYPGILLTLAAVVELGRPPMLKLVRDPDNQFDPNAVAVRSARKGTHLGHLPAALAARIAPEMDAGAFWMIESYEVLVMPGIEHQPGLMLNLRRMPESSGSLSNSARTVASA